MNGFPLLFAADWVLLMKIGGFIVVGLIYLFNNLLQAANKAKNKRAPARPDGRPDARMRPRPAGRPDPQDEVAEFLRRATEKRTKGKEERPAEPRRVGTGEPVDPRILEMRAAAEKRRARSSESSSPPVEIVEARAVEELPSARWPNSVHSNVDTRQLAERAEHLIQVDRAEAAFQAHIQTLDHQVGRIYEAGAPASETTAAAGASQEANSALRDVFANLLADPQSVRQAIVLNEIIQRPLDRW